MTKRDQAMVMSVDERQMILLCPDGTWKAVRSEPGRAVGDIIRLGNAGWGRSRSWGWRSVAAAILLIITLAATSIILPAQQAMAHVSLDGVPGVDLVTNGRGTVLKSVAETAAGDELLDGLMLRGLSLAEAVPELLGRARELGLLPADLPLLLVSVLPARERISAAVLQRLKTQVLQGVQATALQTGTVPPEVEQIVVSPAVQLEAKALGLSAGQYALALQAIEAGVELDLSQIEDGNVAQALKSQGLNPGQMIKQLKQSQDLDQLLRQNKDKLKVGGQPASGSKATPGQTAPAPGVTPPNGNSQGKGQIKPGKTSPQVKADDLGEDGELTGADEGEGAGDDRDEPGNGDKPGNQGKAESTGSDKNSGEQARDKSGDPSGQSEVGDGVQSNEPGAGADEKVSEKAGSSEQDQNAQGDARSSGPEVAPGVDNPNSGNNGKSGKDK